MPRFLKSLPKRIMTPQPVQLRIEKCSQLLEICTLQDSAWGREQLDKINIQLPEQKISNFLTRIEQRLQKSADSVQLRLQQCPVITYPESLPVSQKKQAIQHLIEQHPVIIVCGETGSGKTTQLPKMCLELGRGVRGLIGHTQPRRLAASSVAHRIAEELNVQAGQQVGFKMRFTDQISPLTQIKLMTDGILLSEIHRDPLLLQYDTIIIDEAHERSLNIDFILGYLRQLLPRRPDLKIIITSATIDPKSFSRHFNNAPVMEVSGRSYPVETYYQPLQGDNEEDQLIDLEQGVCAAVNALLRQGDGDVLVFLSGERDIRDCTEALQKLKLVNIEILPLLSRLSNSEQNKIFHPDGRRRVVLATNIAETSLTVPGIKYVVDSGLARVSRYAWRSRMQRLPIEKISQASANQRMGRCGRTSPGVCIRLYSEEDFLLRPLFTEPEVQRTNLAAVILQMAYLKLGPLEDFPFIETPDSRLVRDGYKLLFELHAIDNQQNITEIGQKLARLPIDPKLGRMLIEAEKESALQEVLIIVSALAIQDVRERPMEKQHAADESHKQFADNRSDFISLLNIWHTWHKQQEKLSATRLRQWCKENFISWLRLREWRDTHQQIAKMLDELNLRFNQQPADYNAIHRSLLTGLLGNIGMKGEEREYIGARNRKFSLFPGSGLFNAQPKWLMAGEIVETSKVYSRLNAKIEPLWIEQKARHLINRSYSNPHWEKRNAQVGALENIALYGVLISAQRKVNYGPIEPALSREIFIRSALVEGEFESRADFFNHNRKLVLELETLEAKSRRQDIVVDDEVLFSFYDEKLPAHIYSGAQFEQWVKSLSETERSTLHLQRNNLMQHDAADITNSQYPDHLQSNGIHYPLEYHFDPAQKCDGITLITPLGALNALNAQRCEWLVPGMLHEKVTQLIRSLPKSIRRNFVPAPNFATACLQAITAGDISLTTAIGNHLKKISGVDIAFDAWRLEQIETYLLMNFRLIDSNGKVLAEGRDLQALKDRLIFSGEPAPVLPSHHKIERDNATAADITSLPAVIDIQVQGITIKSYPALNAHEKMVRIKIFDSQQEAQKSHHAGLRQLFINALSETIRHTQSKLPNIDKLCLLYAPIANCSSLKQDIIYTCVEQLCMQQTIHNADEFNQALDLGRSQLFDTAENLCHLLTQILNEYQVLRKSFKNPPLHWLDSLKDMQQQLQQLMPPGFLLNTPREWLEHFPRFLKAMSKRIDKINENPARERLQRLEIIALVDAWSQRHRQLQQKHLRSAQLDHYRWLIEEYRVSLFAQELKTSLPVSAKRLREYWININDA